MREVLHNKVVLEITQCKNTEKEKYKLQDRWVKLWFRWNTANKISTRRRRRGNKGNTDISTRCIASGRIYTIIKHLKAWILENNFWLNLLIQVRMCHGDVISQVNPSGINLKPLLKNKRLRIVKTVFYRSTDPFPGNTSSIWTRVHSIKI